MSVFYYPRSTPYVFGHIIMSLVAAASCRASMVSDAFLFVGLLSLDHWLSFYMPSMIYTPQTVRELLLMSSNCYSAAE